MEEEQPLYLQRENLQYILQDYYARYITREVTRENIYDMKERLKAIDRTWKNYLNTAVEFSQPDQFIFNYQISADYFSLLSEQRRKIAEFEANEMPKSSAAASPALRPASTTSTASNTTTHETVNVTAISLPMFSGGREEWLGFRDAFETNVDKNPSLTKDQRFHFLLSCVNGEPKKLIAGIVVRGDNYDSAWLLLRKVYDEKQLQYHVNRVCNFNPINDELEYIRLVLNDIVHDIQAIKPYDNLGMWDTPIILSVLTKLSNQSRALWEEKLKFMTKPTWKAMEKFLQERCRELERVNTYRP